jgi:hypothetical protein
MNIVTYEVWQDDMPVASAEGPEEIALREARHYAFMYGKDGPVKIYKVTREEVE